MCPSLSHSRKAASVAARDEFALIDWIRGRVSSHPRLSLGIGDDAAALRFPHPVDCLISTDMLMEGTDFLLSQSPVPSPQSLPPATPFQVGRKALAVNLSDIAAMAGTPLAAVVSVALPRHGGFELAQGVQEGLQSLADEFGVALAGGDTNTWDGPLVISVTILGEATGSGPVRRSGAKVGDWIMATGDFGGSIAGKHLDFTPRVREALALHQSVALHSLIDVSDGLAADLGHILDESGVGAILDAAAIPISPAARSTNDGRTPLDHALGDGEDFELLFTVSPGDGRKLLASPLFSTPVSHVGEITADRGCRLKDTGGNLNPLPPRGWKHGFE